MTHQEKLKDILTRRRATHLGVGPMSVNCVDATIEVVEEHNVPLMLIASRRQIEAAEQGGGYVNNWSTEEFARYVKSKDKKGNIILARDHGGPWQNYKEVKEKMDLQQAMESAKRSFEIDIASGFDMIHIDPSVDIHAEPTINAILERVYELYEHCHGIARRHGRELIFEVGTDEQSGDQQDLEGFEHISRSIIAFCEKKKLPKPFFIVVQTGTKVKETQNVGTLAHPEMEKGGNALKEHVKKLVELCNKYGLHLKEHNADYLSNDILSWHPKVGIHAINVAPEFGVVETRSMLHLMDELGMKREKEQFLELAFGSRKWEKWMLPGTKATDYDRSVIAGHYVFSHPKFSELKERLNREAASRGFDADRCIQTSIKHSIRNYLLYLNLI